MAAFLCIGTMAQAQVVWEDFDNPANVDYFYFDGVGFDQNFSNPATGGVNSSAICGQYNRNPGVAFDVIVMDPVGNSTVADVSDYVSGAKKMSIKVYSPSAGIRVQITLEDRNVAMPANFPAGRHSESFDTTTVANQWEVLEFTFSNQPDPSVSDTSVNRLVLLFDPGANSNHVILWDDLMGPEFVNPCAGTIPDPSIGDDVECQRNVTYDFSNGTLGTAANPLMAGINTSSTVGKFRKFIPPLNDGAFGGSISSPFSSATYNTAHIQLYDPSAPQEFVVIFQDGSNNDLVNTTFTTSSSSTWEEFDVNLAGIPSSTMIENFVLVLNSSSSTEDTIFFDNLRFDSLTVDIREYTENQQSISIYPNPCVDLVHVSADTRISEVAVSDITGKVLMRFEGLKSKDVEIDASDFPQGLYFVTVKDLKGNIFSTKLIK
jgi:hypothetical protein